MILDAKKDNAVNNRVKAGGLVRNCVRTVRSVGRLPASLQPTATRVKAQLDRVNGLYTKVKYLLEAAHYSTESSDAIIQTVSTLKSSTRIYDAQCIPI